MIRIRAGRANPLHAMGNIEQSLADYDDALRLAQEKNDLRSVLNFLCEIPWLVYSTKLKDRVPPCCRQGLEIARRLEDIGATALLDLMHGLLAVLVAGVG